MTTQQITVEQAAKSIAESVKAFQAATLRAAELEVGEVVLWERENSEKRARRNYVLTVGNIEEILAAFDAYPTTLTVSALARYFRVDRNSIMYHLRKFNRVKKGQKLARK